MALFALALVYHEVFMVHISADDLNRLSLKQISEKAIRLKEQGQYVSENYCQINVRQMSGKILGG